MVTEPGMHGLAFDLDDACNAQLNSIPLKAARICKLISNAFKRGIST